MRQAPGHALPRRGPLGGDQRPSGAAQVRRHLVEGLDQDPDLAAPPGLDLGVERARGHLTGADGQGLHRAGDGPGEPQPPAQGEEEPQPRRRQQRPEERPPRLVEDGAAHRQPQLRDAQRQGPDHHLSPGLSGHRRGQPRPRQLYPGAGQRREAAHQRIVQHLPADHRRGSPTGLHPPGCHQPGTELDAVRTLHLHRHHGGSRARRHPAEAGLDVSHPRGEEGAGTGDATTVAEDQHAEGAALGNGAHPVRGGSRPRLQRAGQCLGTGVERRRLHRADHLGLQPVSLRGGQRQRRIGAGGELAGEGLLHLLRGQRGGHHQRGEGHRGEGEEEEGAESHREGARARATTHRRAR